MPRIVMNAVNKISNQTWAALFILVGAVLYAFHQREGAVALVSGGFAIFQRNID